MFQEERVTNVHALLGEIGTFLDGAPAKKTGPMDWERFSDRKKSAMNSLDLLYRMFGQDDATSGCEGGKPVIKNTQEATTNGCEGGKPVIKGTREDATYGCEGAKPVIKQD
jgi:hypothetical protein